MALRKEEWLGALKNAFPASFVGSQMLPVLEAEENVGREIRTRFPGQGVLMESFQSLFVRTLNLAVELVAKEGWPKDCPPLPGGLRGFRQFVPPFSGL